MKIVMMNGGLANQTFQYLFGQALAKITGDLVIYDDSHFDRVDIDLRHTNGASALRRQLKQVFKIDYPKLKDLFTPDVWSHMLDLVGKGNSIPNILAKEGMPGDFIYETNDYKYDGNAIKFNGNVNTNNNYEYYWGYWIHKIYVENVINKLEINTPHELKDCELARELRKENAVSVHVRKFSQEGYHWDLPNSYYKQSVADMNKNINRPVFYIFSDNPNWCRENANELGLDEQKTIYVDQHSEEGVNFYDLYLLSISRNLILSNSSFSYLAALLNKNKEKVINPCENRPL